MRFFECRLYIFNKVRRIGDESVTNMRTKKSITLYLQGLQKDFDVIEKTR
jgi:hypothetical protein